MGPDRAEGTVYTSKVEESEESGKFEYRVSFNAKVTPLAGVK
jgi:hypothetical protein